MKVVLIKDVRNMGLSGSVIEVSDGHAINFLFPKKLAISASAQAVQHAELRHKQSEEKKAISAELLAQNIAALKEAKVIVTMKANDKGHLYTAVSAADIVAAAKSSAGVDLPEDAIALDAPIKEVGEHEVEVASNGNSAKFTILVEAAA